MQNACMSKSITVRGVPDATTAELASRAALSGRSLQEYLLAELIELATRPDPQAWLADVRRRKAVGGRVDASWSVGHIEADRR